MATTPITPVPGAASQVTVGGTAVVAVAAGPNGGKITNPFSPEDQGISEAEVLYVSPVAPPGLVGNGSVFTVYPGYSWEIIPGQTTPTYVNAATSGHKFSVFSY